MNIAQLILEALESLNANRVRSTLTMLGIIIGVASVVAMMAIGAGAQSSITDQINSIGTNLVYVGAGGDSTHPLPLTVSDAEAIANPKLAPSVSKVAPTIRAQVDVSVPGKITTTSLMGVTPEFFQVQTADVAEGQIITAKHMDDYASVVILGVDVANELFDTTTNLIGKTVRIQGQIFQIIGILKEQGGTGFGNNDNRILIPLSTVQLRLVQRTTKGEVDMIYVQAVDAPSVNTTIDSVSQILKTRHQTVDGKDDFEIFSTQSFLETMTAVTGTMTLFLGGVAGTLF